MKFVKVATLILSSSVILTGCGTLKGWFGKRDNGTLDYQKSQKLDPIKLPANQAHAEFSPLYPTPSASQPNSLTLTNEAGKQYELPKPPKIHPNQ